MDVTLDNTYIKKVASQAVAEDLGSGDITVEALVPADRLCRARIVAKQSGVLAGISFARAVFHQIDPTVKFEPREVDAFSIRDGAVLAVLSGPARAILSGERTALNLLQHLSGIATLTARYVERVYGTRAKILDTRKTVPGLRLAEKYAVVAGGGTNHRIGLYDMILIKENHLALAGAEPAPLADLIAAARQSAPDRPLEMEVESLEQFKEALAAHPDMIMLDNMALEQMTAAVALRDESDSSVLLEASGNVSLETVSAIAATGVDRISVGSITHSAPALDIALYIDTDDPEAPEAS